MIRPLLYAISSGDASDLEFDRSRTRIIQQAKMLAEQRVTYFQIREKRLSGRNLYELSDRVASVLRDSETRLLINDRADIAVAVGAYGVHLTSSSLPIEAVRSSFGTSIAIFVSTHTIDEVRNAADADAIVYGPVFSTPGKPNVVGIEGLRDVVKVSKVPVLALGGIDAENCRSVLEAGAAGVAAIRAFVDAEQTAKMIATLNKDE